MYDENQPQGQHKAPRSEADLVRERGRSVPRLFSEMPDPAPGPPVASGAGGAGGHEGDGDEGGASREEVWGVLTPEEEPTVGHKPGVSAGADESREGRSGDRGDRRDEGVFEAAPGSGAASDDESVYEGEAAYEDEPDYRDGYASPALAGRRKGSPRRKLRAVEVKLGPAQVGLTAEQRMLVLDTWMRSKLPARQLAEMMGLSPHTLYAWKRRFDELGPAGLDEKPRGSVSGSRLPEATRRAIVMMREQHPDWGCERLHDMLLRSAGFAASSGAIMRVLREEGLDKPPAAPLPIHVPVVHHFERARVNQLWQTDLFTFCLKREQQRPRVYLVAFMDDASRYIVGFGLHATSSGAMVREVFEASIANYGAPEEVLTDNGTQYKTWRGKSAFTELCERRGIRQIIARPRHPQTLGKIERFWGTLWRDFLQAAVLVDLADARRRIGLYIDYYNFHRPHQGLDHLVPADRYFEAAPEVKATLRGRVAANALDLARHGEPRQNFYLTGRVGDQSISVHAEAGTLVMTKSDGTRAEVDLLATGRRVQPTGAGVRPASEPVPAVVQADAGAPAAPPPPAPAVVPTDTASPVPEPAPAPERGEGNEAPERGECSEAPRGPADPDVPGDPTPASGGGK